MISRRGAAVLAAVFVASLLLINPYVRGDGNGYFAWLASTVLDRDLNFRNQYRHADPLFKQQYLDESDQPRPEVVTATGHLEDQWAVGSAVLWAPWFLAAHAVVSARGGESEDGFALTYRRFCSTGTVLYALCAMWLSALAAVRLGMSRGAALAAATVVWWSSSLLVYTYALPFHVPALAAFTVAWFFWYWIAGAPFVHLRQWACWGAIAGLMGMTYHLDVVLMLVVLSPVRDRWRAGERGRLVAALAVFAAAAVVAAAPQWVAKAVVYGSPLITGYEDQFFWLSPRLFLTAFSLDHGVLIWTPIVALGAAGFLAVARRRREMLWMVAASAVFYYVVASYQNWHGLSSFGNRFFVSLTLPVVIGVAAGLDAAWRRGVVARAATAAALVALMVWNMGLAFQWGTKMLPNRGGVDLERAVTQQFAVPARVFTMARRYLTERDALVSEIEEEDRQEWHTYRQNK